MKCKICNNSIGNKVYEVKEMMFGFRDKFTYFQCSICGCLQISEFPVEMSRYYPTNYCSFLLPPTRKSRNPIKRLTKKMRGRYAILNKGVLGKLIYTFFPNDTLRMLSHICLTENSAILDVGCGSGSLLDYLSEIGFKHLLGVDPYIKEDIEYDNGLKILKFDSEMIEVIDESLINDRLPFVRSLYLVFLVKLLVLSLKFFNRLKIFKIFGTRMGFLAQKI